MNLPQLPKVELHLHPDCGIGFEVVSKIDPSVTKETYLHEYIAPAKCASLAVSGNTHKLPYEWLLYKN